MKTIVSAGALAIALGLVGPVVAQTETAMPTMIGNQSLSEADATRVKVYCEDLQTDANQAAGASSSDTATSSDDTSSDDAASDSTDSDDDTSDTAAVGSVDMDLITVETCAEAGFITPTAE